jgi:hypothetical protein
VSSLPIYLRNAWRLLLCVAFAAAFELPAGTARADDTEEADESGDQANIPVRGRVHPHLQPQGLQFGTALFFPQLDAGLLYDSNVFATTAQPEDDFVYVLAPKLIIQKSREAQQHELTFAAKHMEFEHFDSESRTEASAALRSAWEITQGLSLDSNLSAATKFDERGDSIAANASTTLIGYYDLRASAFLTRSFNSFGITAGGGVRSLTYDDGETEDGIVIDQSFRDGTIFNVTLRPFYEFSPGYRIYANLDANRRDFAGEGLLDRDSEGFDTRAGVEFLLTPILFGVAEVGYLEQHYENPDLSTASGMSGKASLTWLMTPLMTASFFASRSVSEIASPDQSVRLDTMAGAQFDYEISRNLIASAGVELRHEDFTGIGREDAVLDVDARLDYTPNPYFRLGLSYLYTDRDSNFDDFSFDRHRVMLNVTASY